MTSKIGAHWCVTFKCNLYCKHCSLFSGPSVDRRDELTTEQAIRLITQMAEMNVDACRITGGEPLIRKDIHEILWALHDNKIPFTLETNGILLSQKCVGELRKIVDSVIAVAVSLDGVQKKTHEWLRGKNTFKATIQGIKRLVGLGIPTGISYTIHRGNLSEIGEMYKLGEALGARNLRFEFMNSIGRAKDIDSYVLSPVEQHKIIRDIVRLALNEGKMMIMLGVPPALVSLKGMLKDRIYVGVGCNFPVMGILPNGDVSICCLAYNDKELIIGNLNKNSLKDIWLKSEKIEEICRTINVANLEGVCAECIFKLNCKGGCRVLAYDHYGRFNAPLPICQTLFELKEFPLQYLKRPLRDHAC